MVNEVFNDRRVCDKCDKVFLLADETTENIEGQCNPEIHEETYEGIYCWECINSIEEKEEEASAKAGRTGDFHKCLHFTHKGQEFEVRITNEYDYCEDNPILEVWTVDYDEQGECQGFGELVAEKYLNGEKEKK